MYFYAFYFLSVQSSTGNNLVFSVLRIRSFYKHIERFSRISFVMDMDGENEKQICLLNFWLYRRTNEFLFIFEIVF